MEETSEDARGGACSRSFPLGSLPLRKNRTHLFNVGFVMGPSWHLQHGKNSQASGMRIPSAPSGAAISAGEQISWRLSHFAATVAHTEAASYASGRARSCLELTRTVCSPCLVRFVCGSGVCCWVACFWPGSLLISGWRWHVGNIMRGFCIPGLARGHHDVSHSWQELVLRGIPIPGGPGSLLKSRRETTI